MSKSILPMYIFKSSMVLGLTFRSLIHFEFIFIYGMREEPSLILSHVVFQFSQHHLLKRLPFLHCISCCLCSRLIALNVWVHFWAFCFVPLICVSVVVSVQQSSVNCSFVVQFEIREHGTSSFVILSQDCFGLPMAFCSSIKYFRIIFFWFCEKCHWYFDKECTECIDCPGLYGHSNNISSFNP